MLQIALHRNTESKNANHPDLLFAPSIKLVLKNISLLTTLNEKLRLGVYVQQKLSAQNKLGLSDCRADFDSRCAPVENGD